MSDQALLERMQKQMDRMADKVDEVLSVLGDIRANEQVTDHRFNECERKIKELEDRSVTKDEFKPLKQAYDWILKLFITAIVGALISLVIYQPTAFVKPDHVIEKPKQTQHTEQEK
jgi:chromosome segregation ATPase